MLKNNYDLIPVLIFFTVIHGYHLYLNELQQRRGGGDTNVILNSFCISKKKKKKLISYIQKIFRRVLELLFD